MILLDSNMLSGPLQPAPYAALIEWIETQALEAPFLAAITVAALPVGSALLPAGKRRAELGMNLQSRVLPRFSGRVLRV